MKKGQQEQINAPERQKPQATSSSNRRQYEEEGYTRSQNTANTWNQRERDYRHEQPPQNPFRGQQRGRGRGRGSRRGRGYENNIQGYSDHEEKSADEVIENYNYQKMREQNGQKKNTNYADFFESPQETSNNRNQEYPANLKSENPRSNKGNWMQEEDRPNKNPALEMDEIKQNDKSDESDEDAKNLSKMLEESILDQQKILDKNAEMLSQPKKPKKGKKKQEVENTKTLGEIWKNTRDIDNPDIDMRTRITGTLVKDHQRENRRQNSEFSGAQESRSSKNDRKGLKIYRPKFIGLTGKFEYRSLIQAGKHMFTKAEIFRSNEKDISKLELDQEGLQKYSGFGRVSDATAQELMDQMLRNFGLVMDYSNHYSKFGQSSLQ